MRKLLWFFLLLPALMQAQVPIISPVPKIQFFAQNGSTPLANGCVFTYQSGTNTPLTTFTDYTGTVTNTNPVILSSGGFANIWLQPGTSYRYAVYSNGGTNCALGSLQYTTDGIAGSSSTATTPVTFSATPTFNITAQIQLFTITLTGNAVAQPLIATGIAVPALVGFQITEDGVGSHSFTWPSNMNGAGIINIVANQTTNQWFYWNGTTANAMGPMQNGQGFVMPGISSPYAGAGIVRMGAGDRICWRNNPNTADECLQMSSVDGIYIAPTATNTAPGTVTNSLAKQVAGTSMLTATLTSDTSGVVGVCISGCGNTGFAVIQQYGQAPCNFDNASTGGDYVAISSSVGGDCTDVGPTYPSSGQVIGRVGSGGSAGVRSIFLFPPEIRGAPQVICSDGASHTVNANTTGNQPIVSCSFAAGALNTLGKTIRVTSSIGMVPAGSNTSTAQMAFGTSSSLGNPVTPATSIQTGSAVSWTMNFQADCVVRTTGAAGVLQCSVLNTSFGTGNPAPQFFAGTPGQSITVDLTSALFVGDECFFGTASGTNNCVASPLVVELLN